MEVEDMNEKEKTIRKGKENEERREGGAEEKMDKNNK